MGWRGTSLGPWAAGFNPSDEGSVRAVERWEVSKGGCQSGPRLDMGLGDRRMETTDLEIPIGAGVPFREAGGEGEGEAVNGQGSACLKSDFSAKKTFHHNLHG